MLIELTEFKYIPVIFPVSDSIKLGLHNFINKSTSIELEK